MKKIMFLLLFILFCFSISAQSQQFPASQANGHIWVQMDSGEKLASLAGYFSAMYATINKIVQNVPTDHPQFELYREIVVWLNYPNVPIAAIIQRLDSFYEQETNRDVQIWMAILAMFEKHWWGGAQEGTQRATSF